METPERPYRRSVERVSYRMPVELSNLEGDFVIRAYLCDVSALAARVEFVRPPRLRLGDRVVINLSPNFKVEGANNQFQIHARVLMQRTAEQLIFMFEDPRRMAQDGFVKFVYGPLQQISLSMAPPKPASSDPAPEERHAPKPTPRLRPLLASEEEPETPYNRPGRRTLSSYNSPGRRRDR